MEFRILGLLEVIDDGCPVDLPAAKVRAVLGMLVVHANQVLSADRLADAVWGDDAPASAVNTIQGYVSRIRKAVGADLVRTHPAGYQLAVGPECIDAVRFERLLDESRRARAEGSPHRALAVLDEALALWQGEPLADFSFAEWAQAEIARLQEIRLVAIEARIEAGLDLGHHTQVLGELDALVVAHPLRERLWAARMLALYRSGRQADALRAYQDLRRRLVDELGVEPGVELASLEQAVLRHDPSLQWRPPVVSSPLPIPRSTFVGREQELRELGKLVEEVGIVTVVGTGGAGKTRLAVEVARSLGPRYDDVRLVELAPLSDPSLVVQVVASAFGVREEPGRDLLDSLVAALATRRLLMVLDNCEHVLDSAARLADALARAAPDVVILATSRQPLRIGGERVWRVPSLSVPPASGALSPEAALASDAVRLFVDRAIDADGDFTLSADNVAAVADICRRLDGIPLAIELAAARVAALTPSQIAARLGDRFRLLRSGSRAAPARHQTLEATVRWSHELCPMPEQTLLRRLSVFAGGFTLEATEAVCGGEGLAPEDVIDALSGLVDRSLVVALRTDGETARYNLLETIRAYAADRLVEAGEEQATKDAHLAWVVGLAASMATALDLSQVTPRGALEPVEREHDNIRKSLEWAAAMQPAAALRIVATIYPFWQMRGYHHELRRWSDVVLVSSPDANPALRAVVLNAAGSLALSEGQVARGRVLLEEAIALFKALGDAPSVTVTQGRLVHAAIDHDRDYDTAERIARDCVAQCIAGGDPHALAEARGRLAWVIVERGDGATARDVVEEALAYNREHTDDPCPSVLNVAGRVAFLTGDRDAARQHLEQNLSHARERGLRAAMGSPLYWLGELALLEGDVDEADRRFTEQLRIVRPARAWRGVRLGLLGQAKVALRRNDFASARSALDEVRTRARAIGDVLDPAYLEVAAELLSAEGRLDGAARLLGAAYAHRATIGAPVPVAYRPVVDELRSQVASGLGDDAYAAAWEEGRQLTATTALDSAFE